MKLSKLVREHVIQIASTKLKKASLRIWANPSKAPLINSSNLERTESPKSRQRARRCVSWRAGSRATYALLATVQMPAGVPVATVAVGKPGARNAGLLAVQILALSDAKLADKLRKYKKALIESSREKNKKLQEKLRK